MEEIILYHNPQCSNSRGALELLRASGRPLRVIEYLQTPPDAGTLEALFERYAGPDADMVRFKQREAAAQGISPSSDRTSLVKAIVAAPILMQRPLVIVDGETVIARPPDVLRERLEDLLGEDTGAP